MESWGIIIAKRMKWVLFQRVHILFDLILFAYSRNGKQMMLSGGIDALSSCRHWHVESYVACRRNSYVFANNFGMSYVFQFTVMEKKLFSVKF